MDSSLVRCFIWLPPILAGILLIQTDPAVASDGIRDDEVRTTQHPGSSQDLSSRTETAEKSPTEKSSTPEDSFPDARSGVPDTTPYTRPSVPEDYAPAGKPAIPPYVKTQAQDVIPCTKTTDLQDSGDN